MLEEVFQLCFSGHTLDDALTNIVVDRDMLRHVLVERPKILKAEREKAQVPAPPMLSGLPPLPRKTEGKRQLGSAGLGRLKRARNGVSAGSGWTASVLIDSAVSSTRAPCAPTSRTMPQSAHSSSRVDPVCCLIWPAAPLQAGVRASAHLGLQLLGSCVCQRISAMWSCVFLRMELAMVGSASEMVEVFLLPLQRIQNFAAKIGVRPCPLHA